jgi:hypothetical protein
MMLDTVGWIFVAGVLVHNTEEAVLLPSWSKTAGRWHRQVNAVEFRFAVVVLSIVLIIFSTAASLSEPRSLSAYLMAGYVLAMTINVFMPHVLATLFMRKYMPGTATALLLNLPLGTIYLYQSLSIRHIEPVTFAWSGPIVIVVILTSIPLLFSLGRKIIMSHG